MDNSSCLSYIHVNTPADDCFPPYIKAQPSFDSIDSSRTIHSAATSRSHSTNSSTTATPALPTAYTEPSTPSCQNGLFQHDIQIPTSMSLSIPALDEQVRYRCKERSGPMNHIPRTSAPLNLNSMNMNVNSMETDLATYVKQLESKSHMMERMTQSVQHRNEVLENEKAEMSNGISILVKQVQWLSRKVNVTLQEVDRLNQFIAEQGGQAQG
ncbi:hypothetical protein KEM56_000489 [Ascosphaera pollenicola]|nr:hypothetical protein KEM56_000489 [Ascosphaera pollenicola]